MRREAVGMVCSALLALGAMVPLAASAPPPIRVSAAVAAPLRIMPLGASSTVGTRSPETAGYRGPLEAMLLADGIAFDMVGSQQQGPAWLRDRDHEGHAGAVVATLMPAVPGWMRAYRPDVVLLHMGTNDLLNGASGAEAARRLGALIDAIYASADPDPYVIVAGVWAPMKVRAGAKAEFTRAAGALVAQQAASGRPITFVDTSALLPANCVADGLHANRVGYQLVADMWHRELRRYLSGAPPFRTNGTFVASQ